MDTAIAVLTRVRPVRTFFAGLGYRIKEALAAALEARCPRHKIRKRCAVFKRRIRARHWLPLKFGDDCANLDDPQQAQVELISRQTGRGRNLDTVTFTRLVPDPRDTEFLVKAIGPDNCVAVDQNQLGPDLPGLQR